MIRVLLVDSSPAALEALQEQLQRQGDFRIVGRAQSVPEAMALLASERPQVLCAALSLGLELTREVMRAHPLPVLLLASETDGALGSETLRAALEAGALEVVAKPPHTPGSSLEALASRIRVLAGVKVFTRSAPRETSSPRPPTMTVKMVAIGASTGGPQALGKLLGGLEANFPCPIVCVQHMGGGFLGGLVEWLQGQCRLEVLVAQHGQVALPGHVYFAPERHHLRLRPQGRLAVEPGPTVDGHCPSASVLFESVAEVYGEAAIGVLLTGMGSDGAQGLLRLAQAGAETLAQDEESSVVFGMARQALEIGAVKKTQPLEQILFRLQSLTERRRP